MTASGFTRSRDERVEWWANEHGGNVLVFDDAERRGVLWNHRRIIENFLNSGEEHTLVVQDDAIPLEGWEDHLPAIVDTAPTMPVSLCHFRKRGRKLWDRGINYGVSASCLWGQAVLYSREFALAYWETLEDLWRIDPINWQKSDDGVIVVHNLLTGNKSAFTTRALFSHAEGHSTLGHMSKGRQPLCTIETDPDGEWTDSHASHSLAITEFTHQTVERIKAYREQMA